VRSADDRPPLLRYLAPAIVGLIALATVGAFALAQRLKREPLILDRVTLGVPTKPTGSPAAFTPNGDCIFDNGRIRFRITKSDRANVEIVDPEGRLVRRLAADRFLRRYRFFTFHWGGRTEDGALAEPGRYKLRIVLLGDERSLRPGGALLLHSVPPRPSQACGRVGGVAGPRTGRG
jgi:hypothetical protein